MMLLKRILFIISLLPVGCLYAQTDFKPGYIVTNSDEIIYGEIVYRGERSMVRVCKFRPSGGKVVKYTPEDIEEYRFTNGKYYVSKEVYGQKRFFEFLIKGQVNVYFLRDKTGERFFVEREDKPLVELPYEGGLLMGNDGKHTIVSTKAHMRILHQYMLDAPQVHEQISAMEKPDQRGLVKLAKNYHNIVCKDGECIVFEKKPPAVKVTLDVVGGVSYYRGHGSSFTGGALTNIWLPRESERFYFRTGLLFSTLPKWGSYCQSQPLIVKIPFMFEYIYPRSTIMPKAACGLSWYPSYGITPSFMGGLNIRMSNSVSLSLEYNFDLIPSEFSEKQLVFSHSVLGGLSFRF